MIVISDTTPLISLMKIGRLNLLEKLYGKVFIPAAVYNELIVNKRFPEEAEEIKKCTFLEVQSVSDKNQVDALQERTGLGLGESEAIILAENMKARLLMMDEVQGRAVAKEQGLSVIGVVGIISVAYQTRLLTSEEVKQCVEKLRQNHRHISESLFAALLEQVK